MNEEELEDLVIQLRSEIDYLNWQLDLKTDRVADLQQQILDLKHDLAEREAHEVSQAFV